jgi:hypothetical protein
MLADGRASQVPPDWLTVVAAVLAITVVCMIVAAVIRRIALSGTPNADSGRLSATERELTIKHRSPIRVAATASFSAGSAATMANAAGCL